MLALTVDQGANPVLPTQWEFFVLGIGVLTLLLFVVGLIDIARSHHLTGVAQAVWVIVVVAFPVIGPLLWFVIGRRATTPTRDAGSSTESSARR